MDHLVPASIPSYSAKIPPPTRFFSSPIDFYPLRPCQLLRLAPNKRAPSAGLLVSPFQYESRSAFFLESIIKLLLLPATLSSYSFPTNSHPQIVETDRGQRFDFSPSSIFLGRVSPSPRVLPFSQAYAGVANLPFGLLIFSRKWYFPLLRVLYLCVPLFSSRQGLRSFLFFGFPRDFPP